MSSLATIGEAIKTSISALGSASVKRSYDPIIETPENPLPVDSPRVWVVCLDLEFREASDRANDRMVYQFGVMYVNKYISDYKLPENADSFTTYVDTQISVVKEIFEVLRNVTYQPVSKCYLESIDWREIFNVGSSRQYGLFHSEIDVEFFIDEPNAS